jgi:hypothetical protein
MEITATAAGSAGTLYLHEYITQPVWSDGIALLELWKR